MCSIITMKIWLPDEEDPCPKAEREPSLDEIIQWPNKELTGISN